MDRLVSVVIPTRNRPGLVVQAVHSALAQTLQEIEVIVVIDGPDPDTQKALETIKDPRLKILTQPKNKGCTAARQMGVDVAQSEWIAHLDDDDEWKPEKLQRQLDIVLNSRFKYPICSCYLIARKPTGDVIWPRRLPNPSEPLSEYLFVRNQFSFGEGLVQTSTILAPKELIEKVPLLSPRDCHDDWDWLLRAVTVAGTGIEFIPEPLSIWNFLNSNVSRSRSRHWRQSFDWICGVRPYVTSKAYAAFLMSEVSARAAKSADWKAFWLVLWEATRHGQPRPSDFLTYLSMWLIPQDFRRWLRAALIDRKLDLSSEKG